MKKFSLFAKPISNVHPTQNVDLKEVHGYLKSDTAKEVTQTLRELKSKTDAKELKSKQFDYVTFSGSFEKRGDKFLDKKSGLLCLDIDDVEDVKKAKEDLLQIDNYQPALLFTSPSGNGLKAVYKYDPKKNHAKVYKKVAADIEKETSLTIDEAPKALSSACFLPYDPEAYLNLDADKLQVVISDSDAEYSHTNIDTGKDANKVRRCVEYLEDHEINMADEYEAWISLGFALATLGEEGRNLYHRVSKLSEKYNSEECDQQFTTCLESSRDEVTLGTFYEYCKKFKVPLGEILQDFNSTKIVATQKPFWEDAEKKDDHSRRVDRLLKSKDHFLVEKVEEKMGVPHEVLCDYNIGLDQIETKIGSIEDALFVPHEGGCAAYYFSDDKLIADHLSQSDMLDSYFGTSKVIGQEKAIIAENPFDAMFLSWKDKFDVISSLDEDNLVRDNQHTFLQEQAEYWKQVYVLKRAVTGKERKEARKFVRKYADVLPTSCEVYWVNIAEQVSLDAEYICEAAVKDSEQTIFDTATYIWNSHTQKHRFWSTKDGKKPKLEIVELQLSNVLGKEGFKKTYIGNSTEPTLIKAKDNIVHEVSTNLLFDHVREDILQGLSKYVDIAEKKGGKLMSRNQLVSTFFKYREKLLSNKFVSILNKDSLDFVRDGANHSFLFFKNTAVKVTKNEVNKIPYQNLTGNIWRNQLLDREYHPQKDSGPISDFEQLLNNVAGDSPRKRKAFRTTLGFLLHTYKDKANTKAVILADQHFYTDKAQGGTGKSIFAESVGHLRKQCYLAGKQIKVGDKFAFMDVELGDQILFFDDVRKEFDFEGLFNVITNDMQVEAKYSNRVTIPFEDSPKLVITTNHVINGEGNSFRRRQRILEFSDHYLKNKSPEQEFGKRLYDDWDAEEWSRFDHFMIECLQEYLSDGLVSYKTVSYQKRKMIQKTSQAFVEWADNNLEANREYSTNVLFEGIDKQSDSKIQPIKLPTNSDGEEFDYYLNAGELGESQIKTFNKWIKTYCKYKGWELASHKTNGYDTIKFKK